MDIFNKICLQLDLGEIIAEPTQLKGGFMHKMYSLFTTKGKYAIKLLNPHVMKRDTVFENYRIAEELEAKLEQTDIPILPALTFNGKKMQKIDGQYFYLFDFYEGKRALGIDCGEDEIETGISEVRETMEHIVYYHSVKDKILKCLNLL